MADLISTLPTAITSLSIDVKADEVKQEAYKVINSKYQQVKAVVEDSITKSITEYVCPDGSVGYHISLIKELDGKKYGKMIGYGPEADSRTHDWEEIIEEETITKPILETVKK